MSQPRRMLVLRAVVQDYIRSQEPIGSATLARKHHFGVSSATIRNDMSMLEDEGYLVQPHTSAGRIPTERGYRYFVDQLSQLVPLSQAQRTGIATFLSGSVSLQDALHRAARLLAAITGQVAVVSSPALARSRIRHIGMVPLAAPVFLVVVITDTGSVAQHTFRIDFVPSAAAVDRLCEMANMQCMGMPFRDAAERIRSLLPAFHGRDERALVEGLAETIMSMSADEEADEELYMAGTSQLAHHSASVDLAPLFDALEEQVVLMRLMSELNEEENEVNVAIGSETHTPGLLNASVVTSGYGRASSFLWAEPRPSGVDEVSSSAAAGETAEGVDAEHDVADGRAAEHAAPGSEHDESKGSSPVAFVGSIGPTHMDYAVTISAVKAVARYLTRFISNQGLE